MKTYTPSARCALATALFVGLIGLSCPLAGADTPPAAPAAPATQARQWYSVTFTEVKPDKVAEYERLQKEELIPALKKAGYTERYAYTRAQFGHANSYTFSTPMKDLAHFDDPNPLVKAIGQPAGEALWAKLAACLVSSRTAAYRSMPSISIPATDERKICVLTINHFTPGRKGDWRKYWSEEMVPAIKKAGLSGYEHYELILGGDANEVASLTWVKNYTELDKGPALFRAIGEKAMSEISDKLPPGAVASVERFLMRPRNDLSILPEKPPAAPAAK